MLNGISGHKGDLPMNIEKEIKVLRTLTATCLGVCLFVGLTGFKGDNSAKFDTLDVERINIVEPDGTVKMIITNVARFPNGKDEVNGRVLNESRKKRSGMLYFNEEGIEAGGFIYDGAKNEQGHSAGMSLTFDQYNGDQVMQILTTDSKRGDKRNIRSGIMFNDRAEHETQDIVKKVMKELSQIKDKQARMEKIKYYEDKGLIGGAPRVLLGKTSSKNNGLFLFAKDGSPRAHFYVDDNDQVKLEVLNKSGDVVNSWPTTK